MKSPDKMCNDCPTDGIYTSTKCEQCWHERNRYQDVKAIMDKQNTVEGVLDEFARQLKHLGGDEHKAMNYLHTRQAAEDRLVELFNTEKGQN